MSCTTLSESWYNYLIVLIVGFLLDFKQTFNWNSVVHLLKEYDNIIALYALVTVRLSLPPLLLVLILLLRKSEANCVVLNQLQIKNCLLAIRVFPWKYNLLLCKHKTLITLENITFQK